MKKIKVTYTSWERGEEIVGSGFISIYNDTKEVRLDSGNPYYAFQCSAEDVVVGVEANFDRLEMHLRKKSERISYDVSESVSRFQQDLFSNHLPPRYRFSNSPRHTVDGDWGAQERSEDDYDLFY
jgi:hypothetical protein